MITKYSSYTSFLTNIPDQYVPLCHVYDHVIAGNSAHVFSISGETISITNPDSPGFLWIKKLCSEYNYGFQIRAILL